MRGILGRPGENARPRREPGIPVSSLKPGDLLVYTSDWHERIVSVEPVNGFLLKVVCLDLNPRDNREPIVKVRCERRHAHEHPSTVYRAE